MPLKLYPPGTRKGNRTYYAIGRLRGRQYEINTGKTDARLARQVAKDFERTVEEDAQRAEADAAAVADDLSFAGIARRYMAAKGTKGDNLRYINRLIAVLGSKHIAEVTPVDLEEAAAVLYGGRTNATKNRQAITPGAAILHWAADAGLRDHVRVRRLKETRPKKRRPPSEALADLIRAAEGRQRVFLLILWAQGWRISETLAVTWEDNIRLADQEFDVYIRKVDAWKSIPMHPEVFEALAAIPEAERTGRLFSWGDRHNVYRWLDPLLLKVGLAEITGHKMVQTGRSKQLRPIIKRHFTPHMARHGFASELNAAGATDSDIAASGTWTSAETVRKCYTDVSVSEQRATLLKRGVLGEMLGENRKAKKNSRLG